ncbi:MAG: hypothetical protein ACOC0O_04370 [Spirochaetota bacterium]
MKRYLAGMFLVALVLSGCDSYRALLFRDGPYDPTNDTALQGNVVVGHPDDVRFSYPTAIRSDGGGIVRWDVNTGSTIWWAGLEGDVEYEVWMLPATANVSSSAGESYVDWGSVDSSSGSEVITTGDRNAIAVADIAAVYPDAVERLNRTFSQDAATGDQGLILAIRTRANGVWNWSDPGGSPVSWTAEPFLEELHWEAWRRYQ